MTNKFNLKGRGKHFLKQEFLCNIRLIQNGTADLQGISMVRLKSLFLFANILILQACETTDSSYQSSELFPVKSVSSSQICHTQRVGRCPNDLDKDWGMIQEALFKRRLFLQKEQPSNYVTESALIYWGYLNQIAKRECPSNTTICPPYKIEDLEEPYELVQYLGKQNSYNQFRLDKYKYEFSTTQVKEIVITESGYCDSDSSTSRNVCAYLNGPSLAEQSGISHTTSNPNPYGKNRERITGEFLVFEIRVTAKAIITDHPDFNSIMINVALPGTKNDWQNTSWGKIKKQLHKPYLLL